MTIPALRGTIARRILVNFRADPDAVRALLPPGLRPKLHRGHAIVGVCLIRLENIRPRSLPGSLGISSENAAHRIAVEWDEEGQTREGVFIRRRDTSSRLNALAGGRLFPGEHGHAKFDIREGHNRIDFQMASDDGKVSVYLRGQQAQELPRSSVFASLEESSAFFEAGSVGFSPRRRSSRLDAMRLQTHQWRVAPLEIEEVHSSFFNDQSLFPPGSVTFDHALLMRDISHEWHSVPSPFSAV